MSSNNEKIRSFRKTRTGETIRSVTSPNGMVTWQRKEVRYISGDSIMGNMEAVLDTFNEAYRGMSDESFYGDYGYHQEYEEEKSFRIEVTGWVDITFEEAEQFISDRG